MNETVLTIEDAARCLSDLVEQVHASGGTALLTKSRRPFARIVPVQGLAAFSDDLISFLHQWRKEYPEPDESLTDDIEQSRKAVKPPHDPWE